MNKTKKILAFLLTVVFLFSSFSMSTLALRELYTIKYYTGITEDYFTRYYYSDETVIIPTGFYSYPAPENYAFIGWSDSVDGDIIFDGGEEVIASDIPKILYARWCKLQLMPEEVFNFNNSSRYFNVDGKDAYYLSQTDNKRIHTNLFKNFGLGPVPGLLISLVLAFYPNFNFNGSCYGMSTVTALQHFGLIDVNSLQNTNNVRELEANNELISYLNYYQAQAASSFLCENKAFVKGNANYKKQLKKMFESVSKGNIVMLTRYNGNAFVTSGHTVLLTGAYKDSKGNNVVIAYDCNNPTYYRSGMYYSRYIISKNFDSITDELTGKTFGAINWTDSFEQFKPFDINGKGNPIDWYKAFFKNIAD